MPNYTIQTPDRRTVRVQAPDAASAIRNVTGYLTTAARAVPFLTEAGAGYSADVRSLDDLISGRAPHFEANWARARAEQQAIVDAYQRAHPFLSNNAQALGTVAPMGLGALGAGRAAQAISRIGPAAAPKAGLAAIHANDLRALRSVARNAFMGAGAGAVYGAARPGDLQQRAQSAADSLGPGAVWGAGVPLGIEGAARGAVELARSVREIAPTPGGLGSELFDTLRRAATGRTPVGQSRQISPAAEASGQVDALEMLRRMGVTPEAIEEGQKGALGKPITTAEAIGPGAIELAQGVRGRAGTTAARADAVLRQRADERPDRILIDTHEATQVHPQAILGDLDQLLADSRKRGAAYFNEATALPPPDSSRLFPLLATQIAHDFIVPTAKTLNAQDRPLMEVGKVDIGNGETWPKIIPTVDYYDELKNQLQGALEGQSGPLNGRQNAIKTLADALHKGLVSMDRVGPAYAEAHSLRGDLSSTEAALRNAQGRLLSSSTDPSSFEAQYSSLQPFEQAAATAAGAGDIANLAYNQPFDTGPLSDPATLRKMQFLFGQRPTEDLTKSFSAEDAMTKFEQSQPSSRQRFLSAVQAPLNMAGRNALGNLLFQDPSATAQALRAYAPRPNAFDVTSIRIPPTIQYGMSGLGGVVQSPGQATTPTGN